MKKIVATSLVTGETMEIYDCTAAYMSPEQRFSITPSERQRVAHRMIFGNKNATGGQPMASSSQ